MELTGEVSIFGIRFRSGGAYPFLEVPLKNLTDKAAGLLHISKRVARELDSDRLSEALYNLDFSALDNCLSEYVNDSSRVDELVKEAVSLLRTNHGNMPISDVVRYLECNERTLQRGFLKHVGLTPKYFGRVTRIQSATRIIKSASQARYVSIAYDLGYFDQAHFIKDFKSIMGITPVDYGILL